MPDAASPHPDQVQDKLRELFSRARLPTSPAVARQIIRLIEDPYSTARQFAELIEADPALAARLLRLANSARYAQRVPVTTIQRAVTVVGLGQLRVVALGFELVGHLDRLGTCPFDLRAFWQEAVRRACLARAIAQRFVPALAEEAFLVGLLQDCGIPALIQGLGTDYADLHRELRGSPVEFHRAERRRFPYTHIDAIRALADMWQLPRSMAAPLATHHTLTRVGTRSPEPARLAAIGFFVGSLSILDDDMHLPSDSKLLQYARSDFKLTVAELNACAISSRQAYRNIAPLLQPSPSDPSEVTDLLVTANRHLQQQASETQDRIHAVEAERDEVLGEQDTLRAALGQYRERTARDPLTGVLNRGAVTEAAQHCLDTARENGDSVTVMFLDVDNFKRLNDERGHDAGDAVLAAIAQRVTSIAGETGCAGRYGGEEFIVVVPGLDPEEGRELSEHLVATVRDVEPSGVELDAPITVSLGAVWCVVDHPVALASLLKAADALMYRAKHGGKDRCCFDTRSAIEPSRHVEPPGPAEARKSA